MPSATAVVSYTSVSMVNTAFPMISSVQNISSGVVAQYAGQVEAVINAMISKRYALPLTSDCPILTAIATRETIYRIAVMRALVQFPPIQQGAHPLQIQHKEDIELLKAIAEGELQLINSSGAVISAGDNPSLPVYSTTMDYTPTMNEGDFADMRVDPNKLFDIIADETS